MYHFPSIGKSFFMSSSEGLLPYSQISNVSAWVTCSAFCFPYHFTRDSRISGVISSLHTLASQVSLSSGSFGTSFSLPAVQGNQSKNCDS